ncbi:MAG: tetratricopeptide repeat protein [Leptospiraceae bacterium]|nr:tetratricopeptide repeat protein [Leptospiraceae bacterium]MCP5494006.1 tetratricopeptide repeat protein [Leptospiraceae bacterium]
MNTIVFEKSQQELTKDIEGLKSLGDKYYQDGKYEEAIEFFENVLKQNPNDIDVLNKLGHIHRICNFYKSAIIYFNKVLKLSSDDTFAYCEIVLCYLKSQEFEELNNLLEKEKRLSPEKIAEHKKLSYFEPSFPIILSVGNLQELVCEEKYQEYISNVINLNNNKPEILHILVSLEEIGHKNLELLSSAYNSQFY